MNATFHTRINNGQLSSKVSSEIREWIKHYEGKEVEIVLKRHLAKRSLQQNKYYWAGVIPIIRQGLWDIGYVMTDEETHDFLKEKFVQPEMVMKEDEFLGNKRRTTTTMNKEQFSEYIAKIQQFGAEILNVYVPDANEQVKAF